MRRTPSLSGSERPRRRTNPCRYHGDLVEYVSAPSSQWLGQRRVTFRCFSTTAVVTADYPPAQLVTLGIPSKATSDLLAWWNQAFNFNTSSAQHRCPESANLSTSWRLQSSTKRQDTDHVDLDTPSADLHTLMRNPDIYHNIRRPRHAIVLCHGLYGFDFRGPFWGLEIHYWAAVLDILRKKIGADVIVRGVPGTGSIASRAQALHEFLCSDEAGIRGAKVNFIGHSMGGLDARYLVSHLRPKPEEYIPVSVTSISTPHKGSPFMDWCNANVGIGNEYVEECIREYELKKGMWRGRSDAAPEEGSISDKLPYSLKTPLFVRPKKEAKGDPLTQARANVKEVKQDVSALGISTAGDFKKAVGDVVRTSVIGSDQKDGSSKEVPGKRTAGASAEDKGTASPKSSLDVVTPLTRALSSLTGYFSSYMLSVLDQPAYAMLSTRYMSEVFNPSTPDMPSIKYFSVAARAHKIPLWHPLWLPKVILDAAAEARTAGSERDGSAAALGNPENQGNDGLVSVQSAKWGTFLGVIDGCDHWDLRGSGAPRWGTARSINPATGKPWRSAMEAQRAEKKDAKMKEFAAETETLDSKESAKSNEDGWLAINMLLRAFVGARSRGGKNSSQTNAKISSSIALPTLEAEPPAAAGENLQSFTNLYSSARNSSLANSDRQQNFSDQAVLSTTRDKADAFLEQQAVLPKPSSFETKRGLSTEESDVDSTNDNLGFTDEVASWISDRLPQGTAERRLLADQTTREQEEQEGYRLSLVPVMTPVASLTLNTRGEPSFSSSWAGSDLKFSVNAADEALSASVGMTLASGPTTETLHVPASGLPVFDHLEDELSSKSGGSMQALESRAPSHLVVTQTIAPSGSSQGVPSSIQSRLRREAGWLEDSASRAGTSTAATAAEAPRPLRRELDWHREERERQRQREQSRPFPKSGTVQGVVEGSGSNGQRRDCEQQSQGERELLERFWIALCQHLYSHGL